MTTRNKKKYLRIILVIKIIVVALCQQNEKDMNTQQIFINTKTLSTGRTESLSVTASTDRDYSFCEIQLIEKDNNWTSDNVNTISMTETQAIQMALAILKKYNVEL